MTRKLAWIAALAAFALVVALVPPLRHAVVRLAGGSGEEVSADTYWTCPMHPEIRLARQGDCPICGMSLVEKPAGGADERGNVVAVTPRQIQLTGVTSQPLARLNLARTINAYGTIDYDETHLAVVSAWVGGRIDKLFVDFTGVTVDKGHPLVSLYSPDLIAAAEEHALAVRSLESARQSGNPEVIRPAQDLVSASRQRLLRWGLSEAQVDEIAQGKDVGDHITLYAPQGGTVIERMAYEGMYVQQGDVLFRVADLSTVWLTAEVYEDDIPFLYEHRAGDYYLCPMHPEVTSRRTGSCPKCGMELIRTNDDVEVEINARAFPGETFRGKVAFTDPVLNPQTRTVRVRVNIANRDSRLKPNMYARASIKLPLGEMLAVPENAVLQSGSRTLVLVEEGEGRFRPQPVRLGRMWLDAVTPPDASNDLVFKSATSRYHEVLDGLSAGDRVVTSGNFLVGSESQLQGALAKMLGEEVHELPQPRGSRVLPREAAVRAGGDGGAPAAPGGGEAVDRTREPLGPAAAKRLFDAYDAIAVSLAADQIKEVAAAAKIVAANAPDDAVKDAATELARATQLDAARERFLVLSDAVIAYAAANHDALAASLGERFPRKAFCPMYPGAWLQRGGDIVNPYYGSKMLRCGSFKPWEEKTAAQ